jgi:hypothetical protein
MLGRWRRRHPVSAVGLSAAADRFCCGYARRLRTAAQLEIGQMLSSCRQRPSSLAELQAPTPALTSCRCFTTLVCRRRLARSLRARLESLPGDWQVFLDTDGDLTFSPATEVALRTADLCYIPYQPTESDHDRATEAVSRLQRLQPPGAKVGGVLYNMVRPSRMRVCTCRVSQYACSRPSQEGRAVVFPDSRRSPPSRARPPRAGSPSPVLSAPPGFQLSSLLCALLPPAYRR